MRFRSSLTFVMIISLTMLLLIEFVEAGGPISALSSATVGAGVVVWQVEARNKC
jgi:predicted membrane metal-binding protein